MRISIIIIMIINTQIFIIITYLHSNTHNVREYRWINYDMLLYMQIQIYMLSRLHIWFKRWNITSYKREMSLVVSFLFWIEEYLSPTTAPVTLVVVTIYYFSLSLSLSIYWIYEVRNCIEYSTHMTFSTSWTLHILIHYTYIGNFHNRRIVCRTNSWASFTHLIVMSFFHSIDISTI